MPNLTIDGKSIEVPAGTTIIQAAEKLGTAKNGGNRIFCVSGHVNKPGI